MGTKAWSDREDDVLFSTAARFLACGMYLTDAFAEVENQIGRTQYAASKRYAKTYNTKHNRFKGELDNMGLVEGATLVKWDSKQDDIVINCMVKARENSVTNESAFLAASEQIFDLFQIDRTAKSCGERFYYLKRVNKLPIIFYADSKQQPDEEDEGEPLDLAGMFIEMRKIIKERDDLKARYEDALQYKAQYDEIKKKLNKIEKESAAFMELLRKKA